jgi:hypothetical protein
MLLAALLSPALADELPEGRYALAIRISTIAEAAWLPTLRSTSTSRVLVELHRDGDGWTQTARVCAVDIAGSRVAQIEVPAPFIAAMPVKTQAPTQHDGRFEADLGLDQVGFVGTVLPETPPPDWDGDGHPGATVHARVAVLGGGDLYVAQAAWLELDGTVADGGARGRLRVHRFEQRTYGATPDWLAIQTKLSADEAKSSFVLLPLGAEAGCPEVIAATRAAR